MPRCALHLSDHLSRRWGEAWKPSRPWEALGLALEANAMDIAEDLLAEQDAGLVSKRTKLLSQTGRGKLSFAWA